MVVEALAGLAIAGNIAQFLGIAVKVCSRGRAIYKASSETATHLSSDRALVHDLQLISDDLDKDPLGGSPTPDEVALRKLAVSCKLEAAQLTAILAKLGAVNPERRRLSSLKKAVVGIWKENDIKDLEKKLDTYRNELCIRMLSLMRTEQSSIKTRLDDLASDVRRLQLPQQVAQSYSRLETQLRQVQNRCDQSASLLVIGQTTATLLADYSAQTKAIKFLEILGYPELYLRGGQIETAHQQTFTWILQSVDTDARPKPTVHDWLRSDRSLYWIHGKPGCGKSTLMKYMNRSPEVMTALRHWSGDSKLIVAHYYFWYAGSPLQRSRLGLVRSLLYEIYRQRPDLVEITPATIEDSKHLVNDLHQCISMLRKLVEQDLGTTKFCFFIDGLDEYCDQIVTSAESAPEIDQSEIIDIVHLLCSSSNIKLCVSSREWRVFEVGLRVGRDRMALHEYTKEDICAFTTDILNTRGLARSYRVEEQHYVRLIDQIVRRAEGVFLWVVLVVRTLKKGLSIDESIDTLHSRLDDFPSSLNQYYQRMLDGIEPRYQSRSAGMITVALDAGRELHPVMFAFLDEWRRLPASFPVLRATVDCGPDTYEHHVHGVLKDIHVCCQDILEVRKDPQDRFGEMVVVTFMHRTVRDYMTERSVQRLITDRLAANFNSHAYICAASNRYISMIPTDMRASIPRVFRLTMSHVRDIETAGGLVHPTMMEELQDACDIFDGRDFNVEKGRTAYVLGSAIQWNIQSYVRHKISKEPDLVRSYSLGQSLLDTALRYSVTVAGDPDEAKSLLQLNVQMILMLLGFGCDPNNEPGSAQTPWLHILRRLYDEFQRHLGSSESRTIAELCQMFLLHGADPGARYRELTVEDIIRKRLSVRDATRVLQVLRQVSVPSATATPQPSATATLQSPTTATSQPSAAAMSQLSITATSQSPATATS